MITKPNLIKLVNAKRLDAKALLVQKRYAASVYIAGYAIELSLKYSICKTLRLNSGFPENSTEFANYRMLRKFPFGEPRLLISHKFRNHDLTALLFYSDKQLNIENNFSIEWNIVSHWSETLRYSVSIVRVSSASSFLDATDTIVSQLI